MSEKNFTEVTDPSRLLVDDNGKVKSVGGVKPQANSWPPWKDVLVLRAFSGQESLKALAREFKVPYRVAQRVIADPRAEELRIRTRERIRENIMDSVEDQLDESTRKAVEVIRRTLNAEITAFHPAKANQDRVALKVLEGRGFLSTDRGQGGGLSMSEEQFDRLLAAIQKSDTASRVDPFSVREETPVVEAEVVEEDVDMEEGEVSGVRV